MTVKSLEEYFKEHKGKTSDKWKFYFSIYQRAFQPYLDRSINLLEIGVLNGGSSEIYAQYFPHAKNIIGCDISEECGKLVFDDTRIQMIVGDVSKKDTFGELCKFDSFDVIIDDASHHSSFIIKAFCLYFPILKHDGIYLIEDLHASYWQDYGGGLYEPWSAIAFFKKLVDIINTEHWHNGLPVADFLQSFSERYGLKIDYASLGEIHSIEFVNSICIIKKKPRDENVLAERVVSGCHWSVAPPPTPDKYYEYCQQDKEESNQWSRLERSFEHAASTLYVDNGKNESAVSNPTSNSEHKVSDNSSSAAEISALTRQISILKNKSLIQEELLIKSNKAVGDLKEIVLSLNRCIEEKDALSSEKQDLINKLLE